MYRLYVIFLYTKATIKKMMAPCTATAIIKPLSFYPYSNDNATVQDITQSNIIQITIRCSLLTTIIFIK